MEETLEEAAERIYREYPNNPLNKPEWHYNRDINCFKKRKAFINGAKYQADKMYSEEEVIDFLQEMNDWPTTFEGRIDIKDWFEQFKKK